ncbi:MAG: hypothetical protein JWN08_2455 [Frankiales bacterium]|nr:hypothetical protein [Frankiales bacterium]
MTISETASTWAKTLLNDTDAHADLYAADEDFSIEARMVDDHLTDTVTDRADLAAQLAFWTNKDESNGLGVHTLTVTETFAGNGHEMIHWDYEVTGLDTFHGLPVNGQTLSSKGSTFLQFDPNGKIVLESTVLNQIPIYQQLGVALITPHYWEEGFDPASLG